MIDMLDINLPKAPRVSLDQWRALQAVVECGGFSQAAKRLNRSQSSVSYAVARLQEQLGVQLLEIHGRKAQLTDAGTALLRQSRQLLVDALELERFAHSLERGWEAEVQLVVDAAFPSGVLMQVLKQFAEVCPRTRVQLSEVVLSGADEALLEGRADLVIAGSVPQGFLGDAITDVEFIAVAHQHHPLHQSGRITTLQELRKELQVVIRDSGLYIKRDVGWLGAEQRWTVSSIDSAVEAVSAGLGFGWLPYHRITAQMNAGSLKALPLREGQTRRVQLFMIYGRPGHVGPATRRLAKLFEQVCQNE